MAKISLADKLRQNLDKAYDDNKTTRNEFTPDFGKTKVRIIPGAYAFGKEGENELFYWNYAFHYIPGVNKDDKGEYIYTPQYFADGTRCPIDEAVEQMFETKDSSVRSIASKIKRKRVYYFHALLYEEGKEPKLIVLKDNTSEGKLANKICSIMGMPFVKDVHQKRPWIMNTEKVEGKPISDLIDIDLGHDLIIDKRKGKAIPLANGTVIHDIDYSETFAWATPRALTDAERELIKELPDLTKLNQWETNPEVVKAKLEAYLNAVEIDDKPVPATESKPAIKVPPKNPATNIKTDEPTSDATEEDILKELEAAGVGG